MKFLNKIAKFSWGSEIKISYASRQEARAALLNRIWTNVLGDLTGRLGLVLVTEDGLGYFGPSVHEISYSHCGNMANIKFDPTWHIPKDGKYVGMILLFGNAVTNEWHWIHEMPLPLHSSRGYTLYEGHLPRLSMSILRPEIK